MKSSNTNNPKQNNSLINKHNSNITYKQVTEHTVEENYTPQTYSNMEQDKTNTRHNKNPHIQQTNNLTKQRGNEPTELKIVSLNVGGLKSKLLYPNLQELINNHDITCLSEINLDLNDLETIKPNFEGFKVHHNIREDLKIKPRHGILILYKEGLEENIHFYNQTSDLALWFTIKQQILNMKSDITCGCVYLPPSSSRYAKPDAFEILEAEIVEMSSRENDQIIVFGDFNAKTKEEIDYITFSKYEETENQTYQNITAHRTNSDTHEIDSYGRQLINLCKNLNIQILNGRVGEDKNIGNYTTKNKTTIDYFIASPQLFSEIQSFSIQDFNSCISDTRSSI